jgi:hypothetical protein
MSTDMESTQQKPFHANKQKDDDRQQNRRPNNKKHNNYGKYSGYNKPENDIELTPEEIAKRSRLKNEIQGKYFDDRFVIVDSNVFMDLTSAWFFEMLTEYYKENGHRLQMFAEQYHEINNRKNKAAWNTPIRKVATKALQRIEEMLDDDVLEILNLDSTSKSDAYADGCFFEEINNNPQNSYTIISRDLDLRIRIKNRFREVDSYVLNLKECDYRNV